jgi:hypothetical protein
LDYTAIIGLITQLAGSEAGRAASQMDRDSAMRLIQSSLDEYGKISIPKLQQLMLEKVPDTKLAGIQDDPRYRTEQNEADAQLNDIIDSGGLTLADKAALNALRNRTQRAASAGRNAILGQMAARGTLDSGAQLGAQLEENSSSANSLAAADEAAAGQAQMRAYEAIRERARNASAGLDRDYRQKSDAARAQDAINAGNAAIANAGAMYNAGLPQQNFRNQLELAGAKLQPAYAMAGAKGAQAKDTEQRYAGMGNVAGSAAGAAAGAFRPSNSAAPSALGYDDKAAQNVPAWQEPSSYEWSQPGVQSLPAPPPTPTPDIEGYDVQGRPIYRRPIQPQGQNF